MGLHMESKGFGKFLESLPVEALFAEKSTCTSHHEVFEDRHGKEIQGILVEHSDAQTRCKRGALVFHRLSVQQDGTAGLPNVSGQHFHEGAFTRTVFPEDAVDGPLGDLHGDPVVGVHLSVVLMDVLQGDVHGFAC